jgi:uncharacterized protein YwbE
MLVLLGKPCQPLTPIAEAFSQQGFQVVLATTSSESIKYMLTRNPTLPHIDVIISDDDIDQRTGEEMRGVVRSISQELPIIGVLSDTSMGKSAAKKDANFHPIAAGSSLPQWISAIRAKLTELGITP